MCISWSQHGGEPSTGNSCLLVWMTWCKVSSSGRFPKHQTIRRTTLGWCGQWTIPWCCGSGTFNRSWNRFSKLSLWSAFRPRGLCCNCATLACDSLKTERHVIHVHVNLRLRPRRSTLKHSQYTWAGPLVPTTVTSKRRGNVLKCVRVAVFGSNNLMTTKRNVFFFFSFCWLPASFLRHSTLSITKPSQAQKALTVSDVHEQNFADRGSGGDAVPTGAQAQVADLPDARRASVSDFNKFTYTSICASMLVHFWVRTFRDNPTWFKTNTFTWTVEPKLQSVECCAPFAIAFAGMFDRIALLWDASATCVISTSLKTVTITTRLLYSYLTKLKVSPSLHYSSQSCSSFTAVLLCWLSMQWKCSPDKHCENTRLLLNASAKNGHEEQQKQCCTPQWLFTTSYHLVFGVLIFLKHISWNMIMMLWRCVHGPKWEVRRLPESIPVERWTGRVWVVYWPCRKNFSLCHVCCSLEQFCLQLVGFATVNINPVLYWLKNGWGNSFF